MIYLIYAYGWDWHRVIAVKSNKEEAINFVRSQTLNKDYPRGCSVYQFRINGGEGKKIYPDWN